MCEDCEDRSYDAGFDDGYACAGDEAKDMAGFEERVTADRYRRALAAAWDEGYTARWLGEFESDNPYRKAAS